MSWNIEKPGDRINGPVTITGNTTLTGAATINGDLTVDTSTLKVDSANNRVGVGTATPSVPLDVVGNAKVSGDLVVDTNTLVVDSANNRLGIGTATPSYPLDVAGEIRGNAWIGRTNIATPTADVALYRAADNTFAISTANVERLRIDSSGNLNLGAVSGAGYRFFVQSAGAPIAAFNSTNAVGPYVIFQSSGTSFGDIGSAKAITGSYNAVDMALNVRSTGSMYFCVNDAAKMTLDSSGRLGIGTASPAAILHVEGAAAQARFSTAAASDARHEYYRNGVREAYINWDLDTFQIYGTKSGGSLLLGTNNTERLRIDASGNLLVGMTSAATSSAKTLHLANATAPSANPSGGGVLYVEGGALKYRGSSGTVTTIANA